MPGGNKSTFAKLDEMLQDALKHRTPFVGALLPKAVKELKIVPPMKDDHAIIMCPSPGAIILRTIDEGTVEIGNVTQTVVPYVVFVVPEKFVAIAMIPWKTLIREVTAFGGGSFLKGLGGVLFGGLGMRH